MSKRNNNSMIFIKHKQKYIHENSSKETFLKIIKKVGISRVYDYDIKFNSNDLVLKDENKNPPKYYTNIDNGYCVFTNLSNEDKLKLLNTINNQLPKTHRFKIFYYHDLKELEITNSID